MGTCFKSRKDKAVKRKPWVLPFICCAQNTVGLLLPLFLSVWHSLMFGSIQQYFLFSQYGSVVLCEFDLSAHQSMCSRKMSMYFSLHGQSNLSSKHLREGKDKAAK